MKVEYFFQMRGHYNYLGTRYTCEIKSALITEPCELQFEGEHGSGKSNNDVEVLKFSNRTVHYMPQNLHQSFPRLVGLIANNCEMKHITSKTLNGLEELEILNLSNNYLKSLPNMLFKDQKKMKYVDFCNNKLSMMTSKLLDSLDLNSLTRLDFSENPNFTEYFIAGQRNNKSSAQNFVNLIDSRCFNGLIKNATEELNKGVASNFKNLWQFNKISDFSIVVGDKEIQVHKCVLAVQSSVFATIFETDEEVKASNKLEIKDCSEEVVEEFLRCLYTGEIKDEGNALDLFSLACTFDVPTLKSFCIFYAMMNLDEYTAEKALTLGALHQSQEMINACFYKIKEIFPNQKFADSLRSSPESLLEIVRAFTTYKQIISKHNNM